MTRLRIGLAGALAAAQLAFLRLAFAQADLPERIPFRRDDVLDYSLLGRIIWVTLLGIALAVAVTWLLRRTLYRSVLPSAEGPAIKLASHKRLTPRLSVYVVEIGAQRIAVVDSGGSLLHVPLDDAERRP